MTILDDIRECNQRIAELEGEIQRTQVAIEHWYVRLSLLAAQESGRPVTVKCPCGCHKAPTAFENIVDHPEFACHCPRS